MKGSSEFRSLKLKSQTLMVRHYSEPATSNVKRKYIIKKNCGQSGIGSVSIIFTARFRRVPKLAQLPLDCICKEELKLKGLAAEQEVLESCLAVEQKRPIVRY